MWWLNRSLSFEQGYNNVRKWTAKFDLFSKKYIIVPINEKYVHATLVDLTTNVEYP
jgi:Ulp1 family protease